MENPNRISMTSRIAKDPVFDTGEPPEISDDQIESFIDSDEGKEFIMDLMLDQGTVLETYIQSIALGDNDPCYEIRKWARAIAKAKLENE